MSKLLKSKFLLGVFAMVVLFAVAGSALAADGSVTKTLKKGMKDIQVKYLQQILNEKGYTVSASGAGSVGHETSTFGTATLAAAKAFQTANQLTADGIVGKLTRAALAVAGPVTTPTPGTTLPAGCTSTSLFSSTTGASCATGNVPPVATGPVAVALATDTPATGNVLGGQAIADLAHFTFTNGTATPAVVTNLKLQRTGYSADTDLVNVYLYNGNVRVTDSATVAAGVMSFNDSVGLFTIPANGSITISVKSDIVAGFAGTAGVTLTSYTTAGATAATVVSIAGNTMTGITATLTTADFGNAAVQPTATSTDPSTDYVIWRKTDLLIGSHDVLLKSFRLRQIGSVLNGDIKNFRLYVDGVAVGTPIADLGTDGYVAFDLSSAPVLMKSGTRDIKVVADIISGSSRTFSFSLRTASDLNVVDSQLNANVLARGNGTSSTAAFASFSSATATINPGALTITKAISSPSSTVVLGGSNILLGKWDVKATGEQMKVENLYVRVIPSVAGTTSLRNGAFYFNGVQIGSTANVSTAAAGTQYTFGSSFVVDPGVPGILEFRADNYAAAGTAIAAGDTFQAEVCNAACNAAQTGSNVQRKVSLTYGSYPTAINPANVLTATVGTFNMAKDQAYGAQTVVTPKTALLLAQYTLTSGSSDTVNADTITATINATQNGSTDVTNLFVTYGTKTTSTKSALTTAGAGVDSVNTWSIGETVPANTSMVIKVYGDVASTATSGTITTSLLVSGTSSSGSAVTTGTVVGQVVSPASSGVLTVSVDSTTPTAAQVVAGSTDPVGSLKIKLAGTNEDQYVKSFKVYVNTVANSAAIASLNLAYATTSNGTYTTVGTDQTLSNDGVLPGSATWTLTGAGRIMVAKNSSVYLKVTPTYVSTGQNSAVSGTTPILFVGDVQAEGTTVLTAGGTGANLINSTGIVVKANSSATYVASGDTSLTTAQPATTTVAGAAATDASYLTTNNAIAFTPGDVIFIDENADATFDPATEDLEVVLSDAGAVLRVARGVFGMTPAAHTVGKNIYRLSGTVATYTNGGLIGNSMTVLGTKLGLSLSSMSPSGATSAGTAKIVFAFTASAANNASDPATNTATLTYVDVTTVKSGTTTLGNLTLYPSEYDTNATYATTCGALTSSKWRCTLSTAGATNQIDENTSRTYVLRGDTAYAANGSIDISIASLGTSSVSTNSVYWTDGTTPQYWVNQPSTYVQSPSPLSSAVASGTADTTAPTITAIAMHNGAVLNDIDNLDYMVITYSEPIDASTVNATLVPGGSVTGVTGGATGTVTVAQATAIVTVAGITTFDSGTSVAVAVSAPTNTIALDSTGTILTITWTAMTGGGTITGPAGAAGTQVATTVKDANGVASAAVATAAATGAF